MDLLAAALSGNSKLASVSFNLRHSSNKTSVKSLRETLLVDNSARLDSNFSNICCLSSCKSWSEADLDWAISALRLLALALRLFCKKSIFS